MSEEMYAPIDDHIEQAKGRAVWQYKDKPNWDAGREIYAQRIQILEDILGKLLTERSLSAAVGVQLDRYAADYNLERLPGESDEDFRSRIRVEINLLRSAGQHPILVFNLNRLVAPRQTSIRQIFPLKILAWIFVDDFGDFTAEELARIDSVMQDVKAAGVNLEIGLQLNNNAFIVSDNPSGGAAGQGVATLPDGSDGGAFVKSII